MAERGGICGGGICGGKGHTLGLKIDNQQGEGTGTISLYFDREVPDELKAIFIEYVHRHLARYGCDEQVLLIDFIEQRLKSDPVARKILAMEETATRSSTSRTTATSNTG